MLISNFKIILFLCWFEDALSLEKKNKYQKCINEMLLVDTAVCHAGADNSVKPKFYSAKKFRG